MRVDKCPCCSEDGQSLNHCAVCNGDVCEGCLWCCDMCGGRNVCWTCADKQWRDLNRTTLCPDCGSRIAKFFAEVAA